MSTIRQALSEFQKDGRGSGKKNMPDADRQQLFEDTKLTGKLVMLEGKSNTPSLLINGGGRHISVPLSRSEITSLMNHFITLLSKGEVF